MNICLKKKTTKQFPESRIKELSEKYRLSTIIIELLLSRGIETEKDIERFLHPDTKNLYDPFLMKGMREAVDRLGAAIKCNEKIVVYGDYDVDGISSAAILSLFLKSKGLDVYVHIPSRTDEGYGLNTASIEKIVEELLPDLILTCDCGISGIEEVELAKDLGVDVIVTDHHEAGSIIPDCIVVNPKQDGCRYPDKYLCGAGVAFKLVQAMSEDDSYMDFIDLASVATIADLVPLKDENRLIVQIGLKMLNSDVCNIGLKTLIEIYAGNAAVTSGDIAYKIAPRLNAAGRMGDAYRSFDIITLSDKKRIKEIINDLEDDNNRRKELCDKIYNEAVEDLASENMVDNRAIILSNPEWSKGVTGIAAARLAGEYNRPTFIMVEAGENDIYKGTSRSINDINIYDILSMNADILIEFGGHSGAAGFSIEKKNIPLFKERVNAYLNSLPSDLFMHTAYYDIDLEIKSINKTLLNELSLIEPTGNSNTKPFFKITVDSLSIAPCKNAAHTSVSASGLQMYAFNFHKKNQFLTGDSSKELIVELCEGPGNNVNAYIKAVSPSKLHINNELAKANYINSLCLPVSGTNKRIKYEINDIKKLLPDNIYGTLFICGCSETYEKFYHQYDQANIIINDYIYLSEHNNYSGVIVSPLINDEFSISNYKKIVFLDPPLSDGIISYISSKTNAEIYVPKESDPSLFFDSVVLDREVFGRYYNAIVSNPDLAAENISLHFKRLSARYKELTACQFAVCKTVFEELGFFEMKGDIFTVNTDIKKPLTDSKIYNIILAHKHR